MMTVCCKSFDGCLHVLGSVSQARRQRIIMQSVALGLSIMLAQPSIMLQVAKAVLAFGCINYVAADLFNFTN